MGQAESPGVVPDHPHPHVTNTSRDWLLEVCVETVEDALIASRHGADRLELCCGLETGGLTPSRGQLRETRAAVGPNLPIMVLVRPRSGDFVWSRSETAVMLFDLETLLAEGANGAVVGGLRPDGSIDREHARVVRRAIGTERQAVFHRAFDHVVEGTEPLATGHDPSLEELIEIGYDRVLTSGREATAERGIAKLARWVSQSRGRLEILAGGGIGPANLAAIVRQSGCRQVHASLRGRAEPVSSIRASQVGRVPLAIEEDDPARWVRRRVDPQAVACCRAILDQCAREVRESATESVGNPR